MTVRKIFQYKYIMLAAFAFAAASCSSTLDNTPVTIDGRDIRFVVGDFPVFGESSTRTVGTPDEGKTSWTNGDELLLEVNSKTLGAMYATFTYNGSEWKLTEGKLAYKEDEVPSYSVYYAPDYKWISGELELKDGKVAGTDEYFAGIAQPTSDGKAITVSFSNAERNYSRLRIATIPDVDINVVVEYFTPAGGSGRLDNVSDTVHSDAKGNAYLYGKFVSNSTVSVEYGDVALTAYTFSGPTDMGKSYALDATVVSLEGMSGDSTKIMEAIEAEAKRGNKDIRLILPYDLDKEVADGILGGLDGLDAGSINLTLMGCEKIAVQGFKNCEQLKSVTLPDVTEICESAFAGCSRLQKVVFGSPLTKVYGNPSETFGGGVFEGCSTDTIGLVLSGEQNMMVSDLVDGKFVQIAQDGLPYKGSDGHYMKKFLDYTFNSVNCSGELH